MGYSDRQRFYDQQQAFRTAQAAQAALEHAERIKAEAGLEAVLAAMTPQAREAYEVARAAAAHEQAAEHEANEQARRTKDAEERARNLLPLAEKLKIATTTDPSILRFSPLHEILPVAMQEDREARWIVARFVHEHLPQNESGCGHDHRPYPVIKRGDDQTEKPFSPHRHVGLTRSGLIAACTWSPKRFLSPAHWTTRPLPPSALTYAPVIYLFQTLLDGRPLPTYISEQQYADRTRRIPYS